MKLHFLATYKTGHELEGQPVERGRRCDCGLWFSQQVVSKAYLEEMSDGRRASFLESCEVVTYQKGQAAWFPKLCHFCERKQIETFHVLKQYEAKSA